jgi:hypothetical protein
VPKQDERIHFLVANLGSEKVKLVPGETQIASLQFFRVPEPVEKLPVESGEDMEREFFRDESAQHGLVFVARLREAKEQIESLKTEIQTTNVKVESLEKGTNQIVMFGVYLLCVSIVGVVITFALSILTSTGVKTPLSMCFQIVSLLAFLAIAMYLIRPLILSQKLPQKKSSKDPFCS